MPYSSTEGKEDFIHFLDKNKHKFDRIIDVGPGAGNYAKIVRQITGTQLVGVEIWAPYIEQFKLKELYDAVYVSDAFCFNWRMLATNTPLIILGDVLEHMSEDAAREVLNRILYAFEEATLWLSLPIVHYPQEAHDGNPYEAHVVADWTHEKVLKFLGTLWPSRLDVVGYPGKEIGCYAVSIAKE